MHITEEDLKYFESLNQGLDEEGRKALINAIVKSGVNKSCKDISQIELMVDDELGIDTGDFVTRQMITDAYFMAKEVN